MTGSPQTEQPCCDLHGRNCEPAAEANDWEAARLEVADVAHALAGTARKLGTTVEACMDEKLEADRGRGKARRTARSLRPPAADSPVGGVS